MTGSKFVAFAMPVDSPPNLSTEIICKEISLDKFKSLKTASFNLKEKSL